jgi:hypothetical protein
LHCDLPKPTLDSHGEGWGHFLERLRILGGGGDPGSDAWMQDRDATEA